MISDKTAKVDLFEAHQKIYDEVYTITIKKWSANHNRIYDNLPQAMRILAGHAKDLERYLTFETGNSSTYNESVARQYLESYARSYAEKYLKHEVLAQAKMLKLNKEEEREYYENYVKGYAKLYADNNLKNYTALRVDHFCLEMCYFLKNYHSKKEILSAMEGAKMPLHVIDYIKGEEDISIPTSDGYALNNPL